MRMLKCWSEISVYQQFVCEKLSSLQVDDWCGYVFKENFKLIKHDLKQWHQNHVQNLPEKIAIIKDRITMLDGRGNCSFIR